ncbi:nucleolar protein dao-5-like [Oryza brachyantha]|uniref:nucleolar protein dao-5-like n=1 Tax=Oryza brachyantha TaxID=4533 RepID=UPI001ADD13BD|nr:nucleolar protein dao-5-like [Oryza brachyantha]
MARKRRAPPLPPPEAEPSDDSIGEEEKEEGESPAAPAPQKPSDHGVASSEDNSDMDTYAQGFQLQMLGGAPHEEEEVGEAGGGSLESEPVRKEAATKAKSEASAKKAKSEALAKKNKKKREASPEPAPSGKAKKAKAEKAAAPERTLSGKSKKAAKAAAGKAAAADTETAPSRKAKKSKSKSKSEKKARTLWTTADAIKILEIHVAHLKNHGTLPNADEIIGAAGDNLDRKNITKTGIYEKVRSLKKRYAATTKKFEESGNLPDEEDDLRMYQLSSEIWGKDAKEAISALASQNNGTPTKSKKRQVQAKKDKVDGDSKEDATAVNENGGTLAENKKGKATKQKTGAEAKIGSSKETAPTASPSKSKKGNHKDKLKEESKSGKSKETATNATQGDGTLVGTNMGKADKGKLDGDTENVVPTEATTIATHGDGTLVVTKKRKADKGKSDGDTQNVIPTEATTIATHADDTLVVSKKGKADRGRLDGDTQNVMSKEATTNSKGRENHEEVLHKEANETNIRREFIELQTLYPNLASFVNGLEVPHQSIFKRSFELISDDEACTLETKIKNQRIDEVKMQLRLANTRKAVVEAFFG